MPPPPFAVTGRWFAGEVTGLGGNMRHERSGFTLIELLIVVVIIGILAAVAIPKFSNTKEKAYIASMKADLRNLATAQEAYLYDFSTYYNGALPGSGFDYTVSQGVTIELQNVTVAGWAASSTHVQSTQTCAIYVGSGGPYKAATKEGEARCDVE